MSWLICRLFHKGFRFSHIATASSGARMAYAKCTKCGHLAGARIGDAV